MSSIGVGNEKLHRIRLLVLCYQTISKSIAKAQNTVSITLDFFFKDLRLSKDQTTSTPMFSVGRL